MRPNIPLTEAVRILNRAEAAEAEVRALRKRLAAVKQLHRSYHYESSEWCEECGFAWPCNTVRAAATHPTPPPMMQSVWPAEPGTATVAMDADDPVWNADPTPPPETP